MISQRHEEEGHESPDHGHHRLRRQPSRRIHPGRPPGVRVCGIVRWRSRMDNILDIPDKIELHEADLKDIVSLKKSAGRDQARPDLPSGRPELRPGLLETPGRNVRHQRHRPDQPLRGPARPQARSAGSRSPARARNTARSIPMKSR